MEEEFVYQVNPAPHPVANKDITWIYLHILSRHEEARGVEKSILGEVLGLFDAAPEFQIVMSCNDATDEELRQLLEGMRHECVILPGCTEASIELLEPAPKWISVRERLPEPGQEILAVVGHTAAEPYTITTFFWDATFDNWARITHWMPLPEPPKMYAADMNVGRKKEG